MSWFHNFSTRVKLFMGFGLVIILLTIVIIAAISSVSSMEETRDEIFYDAFANTAGIRTMESKVEGARVGLFTMIAAESRAEQDDQKALIKEANAEIDALFKTLYEKNRKDTEITRLL